MLEGGPGSSGLASSTAATLLPTGVLGWAVSYKRQAAASHRFHCCLLLIAVAISNMHHLSDRCGMAPSVLCSSLLSTRPCWFSLGCTAMIVQQVLSSSMLSRVRGSVSMLLGQVWSTSPAQLAGLCVSGPSWLSLLARPTCLLSA
jgi:hypothetical protein